MILAEPTCREVVEFLADYPSGELPAPQREAFDSHLAECSSCESYTKTYLAATRIAKAAFACDNEPALADVPEELVRAIVSARGGSS